MHDEEKWRAVMTKDSSRDDQFVYAVVSTGIFCRPSCTARCPRREQVLFFDSPSEARKAGYRPCKRCRPDNGTSVAELPLAASIRNVATPVGVIRLASDGNALFSACLLPHGAPPDTEDAQQPDVSSSGFQDDAIIHEAARQLDEYFVGKRREFALPLQFNGTPFQCSVWNVLCTIPYRETRSYKQIAEAVGKPGASRAVGMANNKNPLIVIVPCHRVVEADGSLVGYGAGLPIKKQLLDLEHTHTNPGQPLLPGF